MANDIPWILCGSENVGETNLDTAMALLICWSGSFKLVSWQSWWNWFWHVVPHQKQGVLSPSGFIQEEFTATSGTGRAHFGWLTNHANAIRMFGHWNGSDFVLHRSALANMWQWVHRGFLTMSNAGTKHNENAPISDARGRASGSRMPKWTSSVMGTQTLCPFLEPEHYFRFLIRVAVEHRGSANPDSKMDE